MFSRSALLAGLTFVLVVTANPLVAVRHSPISIPLVKRFNTQERSKTLLGRDRQQLHRRANVGVINELVLYVIEISIGNPPTQYTLQLDTGSSNTWIGAGKPYTPTSTSKNTGNSVAFTYGSGDFSGTEFLDLVDLGSGLAIQKQGLGVANHSDHFAGIVDGILGVGPVDLTIGSLSPDTTTPIPTVTDNLFAQGTIPRNMVSIYFQPPASAEDSNGVVTFGGTDLTKITGDIHYIPKTKVANSSLWWGIDQTLTYGNSTPIFAESTAGIVDTGTSFLLLNPDAFAIYQKATGGVLDDTTGLLKFTPAQFAALESLFFHINGVTYEFTANAQIFPRRFNSELGGTADGIYGIVANLGVPPPLVPVFNAAFVLGMVFLERFYSVFDTTNNRIGLATTPFTFAETN